MKTLYVHVGTPKTATSSLQTLFVNNAEHFNELGFSFPMPNFSYQDVRKGRNAHFLLKDSPKKVLPERNTSAPKYEQAAGDSPKQDDLQENEPEDIQGLDWHAAENDLDADESEPEDGQAEETVLTPEEEAAEAELEAIYQERLAIGLGAIHEAFEKYDNVLISDESLWRAIQYSPQQPLDVLKKDADEHGYTVKIIVYLRRQDGLILSSWNQRIKETNYTNGCHKYITHTERKFPLFLTYIDSLDAIASKIGKENVIVRRFEPATWVGGTIYEDFLTAIGLPVAGFAIPEDEVNLKLENNYFNILRIANKTPGITREERLLFVRAVREASDAFGGGYEYAMLSQKETAELIDRYREGNERIASEYIRDGQPMFSEKIKDLPVYDPHNDYWHGDLIHFIVNLILARKRAEDKMNDQVKDLKTKLSDQTKRLDGKSKDLDAAKKKIDEQAKKLDDKSKKLDAANKKIDDIEKRLGDLQKTVDAVKKESHKTREMIKHPFRTICRFIKKKFKRKK